MSDVLKLAAERGMAYVENINERRVFPDDEALAQLAQFDEPFPESPTAPADVIDQLDKLGSPATVATTGSRYFGFVTGGSLPAAMGANWLSAAWDQNGAMRIMSPIGAKLEDVALSWLLEVLDLPREAAGGFVTGATTANFTALAAARNHLLARAGWDVEAQGLFGAPEIKVVISDEIHSSLLQALAMVGFGRERVIRVPVNAQGAILPDELPELDDMTIVCIQAGNVNSGSFDPAEPICKAAQAAGAWVHIDGAFGLWARATPERKHLTAGVDLADSWATDGHKWLNVAYDSGFVFCKHPEALTNAMAQKASYLLVGAEREPGYYTPELSRRARGIEVWAALKSLGRTGVANMIENDCTLATRLADGLREAGITIHNDVVINQVFISFGDAEKTHEVIRAVQDEGILWAGSSIWKGITGLRLSVSSWQTTAHDIDRTIESIVRCANRVMA